MQLIVVVEANNKSKTDYMYIKQIIDCIFVPRSIQLVPIYAGNKSQVIKQDKKIFGHIKSYKGKSEVVIVVDVDDNDDVLNKSIEQHCRVHKYHIVYMNKDIEEVFWGKSASEKEKIELARKFANIKEVKLNQYALFEKDPKNKDKSSNLAMVLKELRNNIESKQ